MFLFHIFIENVLHFHPRLKSKFLFKKESNTFTQEDSIN